MKTLLITLATLAAGLAATAKTLEITVGDIRSDKGSVLVMATAAGQEKPVYGMAEAREDSVVVLLTGLETDVAEVSVIHDEDGDYKMKMGDRGPLEGYAAKKCELPAEKNAVKLRLHYPAAAELSHLRKTDGQPK